MQLMKLSVLTAAIQNMAPAEQFRTDPLAAANTSAHAWVGIARSLGLDGIQLSAALAIPDAYVDPASMLDPVAAHLAVRTSRDGSGQELSDGDAKALIAACGNDVKIFDLGFFENLLVEDDTIRAQVHAHLLRVARAAKALEPVGCTGVTGFIGADPKLDLDQNMGLFEKHVIPLLKELKSMGLTYWVEQCPMPGWNVTDRYFNNMAYCPSAWIRMYQIAEKHDVADVLFITYDDSHSILMGTTAFQAFSTMKAAGLAHMINRFHGKDQQRNAAKVALHTMFGQRIGLGCRDNGQPTETPGAAWGRMTAAHCLPGLSHYNPEAQNNGSCTDWLAHQYYARTILGLNPEATVFHIEHEWIPARVQDPELVTEALRISVEFMRGVDRAAAAKFQSLAFCESRGLPVPGTPNPQASIPELESEVSAFMSGYKG